MTSPDSELLDLADWSHLEAIFQTRGVVIDRRKGSAHPRYPDTIYPVDYGYLPGTLGGDVEEIDAFVASAPTGVTAAALTQDPIKSDRELKLLIGCTPEEIAAIVRFLMQAGLSPELIKR